MTTNMRKIVQQNQLCGFLMALDGIAITWGALIQNLRCELGLTDEQVQKIIRVGDRYWEMVGEFKNEGMARKSWQGISKQNPHRSKRTYGRCGHEQRKRAGAVLPGRWQMGCL